MDNGSHIAVFARKEAEYNMIKRILLCYTDRKVYRNYGSEECSGVRTEENRRIKEK